MSNVTEYNATILKLHSNVKQPKPSTADEEYLETTLKGIAVKFPLIEDAVTRKIRAVEAKDESQIKSTSSDVEAAAKMLLESCDFAEKLLKSI